MSAAQASLFAEPPQVSLRWRLVDQWYAVSECGRYRISRAYDERGERFDAWFGQLAHGNMRHLYSGTSKAAAIDACVADAVINPPQVAASTANEGVDESC